MGTWGTVLFFFNFVVYTPPFFKESHSSATHLPDNTVPCNIIWTLVKHKVMVSGERWGAHDLTNVEEIVHSSRGGATEL
jgi:hypothetical protein